MNHLEKYRKELVGRIALLVILMCLALIFVTVGNFYLKDKLSLEQGYVDAVSGFLVGFELTCLAMLSYIATTLRNEKALKKMYTREHDERIAAILAKSGCPLIGILSMILLVIAILAGYFNVTVALTLVAVALLQDLVMFGLLFYWKHKL